MTTDDRAVDDLLERVNLDLGVSYRLHRRFTGGENHGAYEVLDAAGRAFAFKYHDRADILPRLHRARAVTRRVRELQIPAPDYLHIGTLADIVFWVQTVLLGEPLTHLSPAQVAQLLEWNDLQAGEAISAEQDWSWYVRAVVFAGESGWAASLKAYSDASRALLGRLERLTAGKEGAVTRRSDIVHGDLGPYNVLVAAGSSVGRASGIVDWDAAGCGDRALDLSKLLFYSFEDTEIRARLRERIVQLSGSDALVVYLAYNVLAQLDWVIRHHGPEAVATWLAKAESILDTLEVA
jgi:aminoglycoside phosphotransferase (APT) family kinase protein